MAAKKERVLDERVERTIRGLRVAGMSERSLYEGLRRNFKEAPSYRDVRAAFERAGLRTRRDATLARRSKEPILLGYEGQKPVGLTHYRERLREVRLAAAANYAPAHLAEGRRRERAQLDDNFIVGYAHRAGVGPDDLKDDAPVMEQAERIERGERSP